MDLSTEAVEPNTGDGIYGECPLCGGLVANQTTHEAWHVSRGEEVDHAND